MTKFWKKYFGGDITLKLKIGRMSMLIGAIGLLLYALVSRFVMNQKPRAFLASIIGAFVLLTVFYLTLKVKNVKNIPFCLFMFLDLLLIVVTRHSNPRAFPKFTRSPSFKPVASR